MTTKTLSGSSSSAKRVFAYGRASLDRQQLTIPAQESSCKLWFDFQKQLHHDQQWEWCGWFPDAAVSSKRRMLNRPVGQQVIEMLRTGDTIVVAKFDRAFRSIKDYLDTIEVITERGCHFEALDMPGIDPSTPTGKCVQSILAAVKQLERDDTSARTKAVKQWQLEHGIPLGANPPFGWRFRKVRGKRLPRRARVLEIDPYARRIGAYIATLRDDYKLSWTEVVAQLKRENVRHPGGARKLDGETWQAQTVGRYYRKHLAGYPIAKGATPCSEAKYRKLMRRG